MSTPDLFRNLTLHFSLIRPVYEQQVLEAWRELNDEDFAYDVEDFFWFREVSDKPECSERVTDFVGGLGTPHVDFADLLNRFDGRQRWTWLTGEGRLIERSERDALVASLDRIIKNVGGRAPLISTCLRSSDAYKNSMYYNDDIDESEIEILLGRDFFMEGADWVEEYTRFFRVIEMGIRTEGLLLFVAEFV